ncbi:DUF947-domain-containing protein [Thozetella sp. PMI_491]|nr:DUF947-domain-containing protein [Thozetella sp. PMI_491]
MAAKRRIIDEGIQRRVRPRVEKELELDASDSSDPSEEGFDSEGRSRVEDDVSSDQESESESDASLEEDAGAAIDASQLSFGALAKAQAALPSSRKQAAAGEKGHLHDGDAPTKVSSRTSGAKAVKRANKHAPQEMSSKRPVSRKRGGEAVPKAEARDPRFGPLGAPAAGLSKLDEIKARKAYAFLDGYRDDEMRQLRTAIKKTKDARQKEELQRALLSMQSKKKDQERRDREQAVVDEHRRKEKELVKQGKMPFFLKKSEQKKRVLLDKFASMKKGQVDKAIERKRKKVAAKERKEMPMARRGLEEL